MPFASKAQEGYFNANRKKMEEQGVNVGEWNQASKGLKLPEHIHAPGMQKPGISGILNMKRGMK